MEFDLNARSSKWKSDREKQRSIAKKKLESECHKKSQVIHAKKELQQQQKEKKKKQLQDEEIAQQVRLGEELRTAGIHYSCSLKPVPISSDGDLITLPPSALEELTAQEAFRVGKFTFELSVMLPNVAPCLQVTHASVLEFTAEEETIGVPPKVARCLLFSQSVPKSIQIRFVRLERGLFARFQPKEEGFGAREIDLKLVLERSLHRHTTLTIGDTVLVRHGRKTFEISVIHAEPEEAIDILNTDLEVDIMPSEAVVKQLESMKMQKETELEAKRNLEKQKQEKELLKSERVNALPPEPPLSEKEAVKVVLRHPDGVYSRRFRSTSLLAHVYEFLESCSGELASNNQLVNTFPRKSYPNEKEWLDKSLEELQWKTQITLFVEKVPTREERSASATTNESNTTTLTKENVVMNEALLPPSWQQARAEWECNVDKALSDRSAPQIHAIESILTSTQVSSADPEKKWEAHLQQLDVMGFNNTQLNISVLERYQGRLLRTVNYLSELSAEDK
uniref:Uncharacterized protein AlNc14C412G11460 n=1 Tax=Albugo laibachii Nc14 TaxID=890382 RepID=F0W152_9STRA|nr:conserved hypothetical protein [Albugo laibachii Nc14]CCA26767.1 conserved hypothetical protein [Albugo laibachii Nc14]|eukprot:CCA26767.1 conserved hypothetical protein [Albugo laibachii Nc14]